MTVEYSKILTRIIQGCSKATKALSAVTLKIINDPFENYCMEKCIEFVRMGTTKGSKYMITGRLNYCFFI